MNQDLIEILCCPETKQPVEYAENEVVRKINGKIAARQQKNRAGTLLTERIDGALIRKDKKFIYPIKSNIPIMLIDEAIELI